MINNLEEIINNYVIPSLEAYTLDRKNGTNLLNNFTKNYNKKNFGKDYDKETIYYFKKFIDKIIYYRNTPVFLWGIDIKNEKLIVSFNNINAFKVSFFQIKENNLKNFTTKKIIKN